MSAAATDSRADRIPRIRTSCTDSHKMATWVRNDLRNGPDAEHPARVGSTMNQDAERPRKRNGRRRRGRKPRRAGKRRIRIAPARLRRARRTGRRRRARRRWRGGRSAQLDRRTSSARDSQPVLWGSQFLYRTDDSRRSLGTREPGPDASSRVGDAPDSWGASGRPMAAPWSCIRRPDGPQQHRVD